MRRMLISSALLLTSFSAHAQTPSKPAPPATLRSTLLAQLRSTHNHADWFTPMNAAVAGMTPEQAKWIPMNAAGKLDPNANHSVGMLACHLVFWNEQSLARLRGENPANPATNDETFNNFDAAQWNDVVKRLDKVMTNIEGIVEAMPEDKLQRVAPMIANIGTHNAYHTGQILYVRKLQGSWNPENGVK